VGSFLLWTVTFGKSRVYEFGLGVNQSRYPFAAVRILKEMNFSGNIYNSWKLGGFLQWQLPGAQTFIDGRCLPAQLELYDRFQSIDLHAFSRYLTEHDVKAALLDRQDARDVGFFSAMPGFRQVHADDLSVLFVREDLATGPLNTTPGKYRYLRLGGYDFEYLAPLATGPQAALLEEELLTAIKAAPESFFENFLLAYYYDLRKDPRAAAQYLLAARKNPGFAFTHFNIGSRGGQAALRSGQWAVAAEIAAAALEHQQSGELFFLLGVADQKLGKQESAEKAYRSSLAIAENGRVRNNLAFLLLDRGASREAIDNFQKTAASADASSSEQALYGLVLAWRTEGRQGEAMAALRRLKEEHPESQYLKKLEGQ
jgi:Tfp pilus assembly protein PilF